MKKIIPAGAGLLATTLLVICDAPGALAKPQKKSTGSGQENADPLVNAAMMAGENVAEPVVRRVFASSLDFVVHLDRDATGVNDGPVRRQVVEVLASGDTGEIPKVSLSEMNGER